MLRSRCADDVFQMVLAGVKTLGLRMLVADASLLLPFVAENSKVSHLRRPLYGHQL